VSAPIALARAAAAAIPACHAVFVPGSHTAPSGHLGEILNAVRRTGQLAPRRAADQLGDAHELAGQSSLRRPAAPRAPVMTAAITIRNPDRKPASPGRPCLNCALDASALISSTEGR